jgi:hypothetical protein
MTERATSNLKLPGAEGTYLSEAVEAAKPRQAGWICLVGLLGASHAIHICCRCCSAAPVLLPLCRSGCRRRRASPITSSGAAARARAHTHVVNEVVNLAARP